MWNALDVQLFSKMMDFLIMFHCVPSLVLAVVERFWTKNWLMCTMLFVRRGKSDAPTRSVINMFAKNPSRNIIWNVGIQSLNVQTHVGKGWKGDLCLHISRNVLLNLSNVWFVPPHYIEKISPLMMMCAQRKWFLVMGLHWDVHIKVNSLNFHSMKKSVIAPNLLLCLSNKEESLRVKFQICKVR